MVTIKISNKTHYTLVAIAIIILLGVVVYAAGGTHSLSEVTDLGNGLDKIGIALDEIKGSLPKSCAMTASTYYGDLGGIEGAHAKCVSEFGQGWYFATCDQFLGNPPGPSNYIAWCDKEGDFFNTCNYWESTSPRGLYVQIGLENKWEMIENENCDTSKHLTCCNY